MQFGGNPPIPLDQPAGRKVAKIFEVVLSVRRGERRKLGMPEFKIQLTAGGDLCGIVDRVMKLRQGQSHLLLRLHIEFFGREGERVVVVDRPSGLNRNQNLLHPGVLPPQIMAVVGRDQRDAGVVRQHPQRGKYLLLLRQAVVLYLDKEVVFAENLPVLQCSLFRACIVVHHQPPRDFSGQTCRQRDQPFMVSFQQFQVDTRFAVKAFD